MPLKRTIQPIGLTHEKDLRTLVEHKTTFTLEDCELNIFETYTIAHKIPLTFSDLIVTSMLKGKKVMHLFDKPGFDYLPGESVIIPANHTMHIDFPEAASENPTQCIALAIDEDHINKTLDHLNEKHPRVGHRNSWHLNVNDYHFMNDEVMVAHMNRIVRVCRSSDIHKDALADMALQELIVRLAQNQHLKISRNKNKLQTEHPLYYVTQFIRERISEKMRLEDLYKMACMSKVTFYRSFKKEFGISPSEYILHERIRKAKQLLSLPETSISDVCHELGFADTNYFHRQFKKTEGITPKQFKLLTVPTLEWEP